MKPTVVCSADTEHDLKSLGVPLKLAELLPGSRPWEVELGFGKGRFLLGQAQAKPSIRFLGIEVAEKYYRIALKRMRRKGLDNVVLVRGEALYLLSVVLPPGFAEAVHVYFPDPWPKSRHQKRRLFDPITVDLVIGMLTPGGHLYFATDHLEYGEFVVELLSSHTAVSALRLPGVWTDGPRTNYEAKYVAEGRPIVRLEVTLESKRDANLLHPMGKAGILTASTS